MGWFYYLGEIALKRLQNRVLQHRFGSEPAQRPQEGPVENSDHLQDVREFDEQLDQWWVLPAPASFGCITDNLIRTASGLIISLSS